MSDVRSSNPVLILGAGINGTAVARELALNGVPVMVVDQTDIAFGATSKSSRLIHGGVRYLEYGDFGLVAESLRERERLLTLAPQFVRPLRLHIPVGRRFGGLAQSAVRFLKLTRLPLGRQLARRLPAHTERGLTVVRLGLTIYDWLARSSLLPSHSVERVGAAEAPAVDSTRFHWLCSYSDAQMLYPERFVLALLEDARQAAEEAGIEFQVLPYHRAEFQKGGVIIRSLKDGAALHTFTPAVIVNATGAWGDLTLEQLGVPAEQLLGGTKGSHFITAHAQLRHALGNGGVYAEAADGRLIFILPFAESVLVGTTDERFSGLPDQAVASEEELQYLIGMVHEVFPDVDLHRNDIIMHYSGVRPLPYVPEGRTGAISRGHWIHATERNGIPIETLIGGKLTTWRAFGEEVAEKVFQHLRFRRSSNTRDRLIPGAENYPQNLSLWCHERANESGYSADQLATMFALIGTRVDDFLRSSSPSSTESVPNTNLPVPFVDWVIKHEWVSTLGDLVERRLGLVFASELSREALNILAERLCQSGRLKADDREQAIADCITQLQQRYGITVSNSLTVSLP